MAQFNALVARYKEAEDWLNYRAGLICSVIANVNRDPKKKPEPFTPSDFMPQTKKVTKEMSQDDLLEQMRLWNAAAGGIEVING